MTDSQNYSWFGLGGNCGDVHSALSRARTLIESIGTSPLQVSNLYRSEPWGYNDQADFINQVVGVVPNVSVDDAFERVQQFERTEGRKRTIKWGPRNIDIDILYWPGQIRTDNSLTIPHPRLHERRFVLAPWAELAPDLLIPGFNQSVSSLLDACVDEGWLEPLSL
ncbi:MAG: 2-amino-4-hydroxy-6-hydroxymethyldihydropteridine diphosphokinase [Bradymonadia bacterium]